MNKHSDSMPVKWVFDPSVIDYKLEWELASAVLGVGRTGIMCGIGKGKDAQSSYGWWAEDILQGQAVDKVSSFREYERKMLEDKGLDARRSAMTRGHDWDGLLKVAKSFDDRFCGERVRLPFCRCIGGPDAPIRHDADAARIYFAGNMAFWPSVDCDYYASHYYRHNNLFHSEGDGAHVPVWRDYVYRGVFTMADMLIKRGMTRLIYISSRGEELCDKNNAYISSVSKANGFADIMVDALKDAALKNDVQIEVMFFCHADCDAIRRAFSFQCDVDVCEYRPFPVREEACCTEGLSCFVFTDGIRDPRHSEFGRGIMFDVGSVSRREAVRQVLGRIALRCKDDGRAFTDDSRLRAMAECLAGSRWSVLSDGRLAKIWRHADFDPRKPVVVVSSHVDMVAERCYAECDGEIWRGSFDNLVTNAVVLALMQRDELDPQVLVSFTGDEEEDGGGANETADTLLNGLKLDVRFVIATDVTEEGYASGKAVTLENVLPEDEEEQDRTVAALLPAFRTVDANPLVIVEGEPDEAWDYDEWDLPCCSVCLPCAGEMHSEEGVVVRADSMDPYAAVLAGCARAALE